MNDPNLQLQTEVLELIRALRESDGGGSSGTLVIVFLAYISLTLSLAWRLVSPRLKLAVDALGAIADSVEADGDFRKDVVRALEGNAEREQLIVKALDRCTEFDAGREERDKEILGALEGIADKVDGLQRSA